MVAFNCARENNFMRMKYLHTEEHSRFKNNYCAVWIIF